jgi:phenylpropionate dioxygenase-like ring-hydroxylating dioxygenase large terminal subunit
MYLRNTWYVAGFATEVDAGGLLARRLLGQPIVFFRGPQGAVAALADRCPHRFAPLSLGQLCDGGIALQCPYHGLRFDATGVCVQNPHGKGSMPQAARVQTYAVAERHGLLWWWAGDMALADPNLIPEYGFFARAHSDATFRGYLRTQCHYELLVDNILDLTHADYLHAGSLGNGSLTRSKAQITDLSERSLNVVWLSNGERAPPAFEAHLRRQGEPTDQWTEVTWTGPGNMLLRVGATLQGESRSQGVEAQALHLATPETESTTHYWFWSTRSFAISAEANAHIRGFVEYAFAQQDKPMLEAQYRNMDGAEFWSMKPLLLSTDAAAVRARRKLAKLIEAEP